jgi:hypothetical protein
MHKVAHRPISVTLTVSTTTGGGALVGHGGTMGVFTVLIRAFGPVPVVFNHFTMHRDLSGTVQFGFGCGLALAGDVCLHHCGVRVAHAMAGMVLRGRTVTLGEFLAYQKCAK